MLSCLLLVSEEKPLQFEQGKGQGKAKGKKKVPAETSGRGLLPGTEGDELSRLLSARAKNLSPQSVNLIEGRSKGA